MADERLQFARMALLDDMRRNTTAANAKGGRNLVATVVRLLQPRSSVGKKLAECGRRNPRNNSREFCEHPACPVCMRRRGAWLFLDRLWPVLETVPPSRLRWITVLMFQTADLDQGARKMEVQRRRLQHVLKKFSSGASDKTVRAWGAREVERDGDQWLFHVHMLVDCSDADPANLATLLRTAWGSGERQVQVKPMLTRSHRANIFRIAQYMTKARYSSAIDGRHVWLSNDDIVAIALWRDRVSAQWHRFSLGVRGSVALLKSTPHK